MDIDANGKNGKWVCKRTHEDEADEEGDSLEDILGKLLELECVSYMIVTSKEERADWN